MRFAARYDRVTRTISGGVCALLIVVAGVTHNPFVLFAGCALIIAAFAWSPLGYALIDGKLVIRRLIASVSIPVSEIQWVRAASAQDFAGVIRLWGSGGLFGYYGLYRTSRLGQCRWYITDRRKCVVVATAAKTLLVSPDDRDGFLAACGPLVARGAESTPVLLPPVHRRMAAARKILLGVSGALLVFGLWLGRSYAPGVPGYQLTANSLVIRDTLYPVTIGVENVDVAGVRVVDLNTDSGWKPVTRVNGWSNSQYRAGWFRTANGATVRLYTTGARRLVLLPGAHGGNTVLLEAEDPDGFAARIRAEWQKR